MKVKDLIRALVGVDEELEVEIMLPPSNLEGDCAARAEKAEVLAESSISNESFMIFCNGETFSW